MHEKEMDARRAGALKYVVIIATGDTAETAAYKIHIPASLISTHFYRARNKLLCLPFAIACTNIFRYTLSISLPSACDCIRLISLQNHTACSRVVIVWIITSCRANFVLSAWDRRCVCIVGARITLWRDAAANPVEGQRYACMTVSFGIAILVRTKQCSAVRE